MLIQVNELTSMKLKKLKITDNETYDSIINRLMSSAKLSNGK
jgi:hypothetical protein